MITKENISRMNVADTKVFSDFDSKFKWNTQFANSI